MAKTQNVESAPFVLPKRKVFVRPVIFSEGWLSAMGGKNHIAAWRQDNAKFVLQVPVDRKTRALVEPLTDKEREFFESDRAGLGFKPGDLLANQFVTDPLRHNKILKSYWTKHSYTLRKSGKIDEESVLDTLDLTNPMDYLNYAILRANIGTLVGTNPDPKTFKGTYIVIMIDEDVDDDAKATKADKLAEAFTHYASISSKPDKLREVLTIAWLEKFNKIKPSKENKLEWLKAEASKFIQMDSGESYLKVVNNNYEDKAFIYEALEAGAIKLGSSGYTTDTGMPLGVTVNHVINYFADPRNQELAIVTKQKIGQSKV